MNFLTLLIFKVQHTRDSVSDVFCLLLAEAFYRKFASKTCTFDVSCNQSFDMSKILQEIVDRLIVTRLELTDYITKNLGSHTDWHTVASNLIAIALIKQVSVESLMDFYLQSRLVLFYLNRDMLKFFKHLVNSLLLLICRIEFFYA